MKRAKPKKIRRSLLVDSAMRARRGLDAVLMGPLGTRQTCLHLATITRRILLERGVPSEIKIGAIRLVTGRDWQGPVGPLYDPAEVADEWHAWVRVGPWLIDASVEDLHTQLTEVGHADARTYEPRRLFAQPVLVEDVARLRDDGHASYEERELPHVFAGLSQSPGDMDIIDRATEIAGHRPPPHIGGPQW